jgi:hypothetical protein
MNQTLHRHVRALLWISIVFLLFFIAYTATIGTAFAQQGFVPPEGNPIVLSDIEQIIIRIANFMIFASGFLMVIFIIWAGIAWMSSGSDTAKAENARRRLTQGVIGAVIVLGVGVILNTGARVVSLDFFGIEQNNDPMNTNPAPGTLGASCTNSNQCQGESRLICDNNVCRGDIGHTCTQDTQCAFQRQGLVCDGTNGCRADFGGSCSVTSAAGTEYLDDLCRQNAPDGPMACDNASGTCKGGVGFNCVDTSITSCADNLVCNLTTGVCN